MAFLNNDALDITGSIGNLSVVKMKGIDKTVVRLKGGASKKKIATAPEFELTRQNATEFGACGMMGGALRRAMIALAPISDYNYTPALTALAKFIQPLDTESERGKRNILLSKNKHLLNGFSLCRNVSFDSVVKHPLEWSFNREVGQAKVVIPALTPGVNLILSKQYPMFRFVITLGSVADKIYNNGSYVSEDADENVCVYSDWYHAGEAFPGVELELRLQHYTGDSDDVTLVLAAGLQMGNPLTPTVVTPVKRAGAAKVIAVG